MASESRRPYRNNTLGRINDALNKSISDEEQWLNGPRRDAIKVRQRELLVVTPGLPALVAWDMAAAEYDAIHPQANR